MANLIDWRVGDTGLGEPDIRWQTDIQALSCSGVRLDVAIDSFSEEARGGLDVKPEIGKREADEREAGKGVKSRSQAPFVSVCARLSQRERQIRLLHSSGRGFTAGRSRFGPCVLSVSLCYPWTFEGAQVRRLLFLAAQLGIGPS